MDVGWFWLRRCYIVVYFAHLDEIGRSRMIKAFIRALTVIAVGAIPDFGQVGKVVLKEEKGPGCYLAKGGRILCSLLASSTVSSVRKRVL